MKIGDKILTELDKQGKSKKGLAEYIGGEPASISDWNDSDNLRFWNVVKPSEFLNVSLNYLAYGKEPSIPRITTRLCFVYSGCSFRKHSGQNSDIVLSSCLYVQIIC